MVLEKLLGNFTRRRIVARYLSLLFIAGPLAAGNVLAQSTPPPDSVVDTIRGVIVSETGGLRSDPSVTIPPDVQSSGRVTNDANMSSMLQQMAMSLLCNWYYGFPLSPPNTAPAATPPSNPTPGESAVWNRTNAAVNAALNQWNSMSADELRRYCGPRLHYYTVNYTEEGGRLVPCDNPPGWRGNPPRPRWDGDPGTPL